MGEALELSYFDFENASVFVSLACTLVEADDDVNQNADATNAGRNGSNLRKAGSVFEAEVWDPPLVGGPNTLGSLTRRLSNALRCTTPAYAIALIYIRRLRFGYRRSHLGNGGQGSNSAQLNGPRVGVAWESTAGMKITPSRFQRVVVACAVVAAKYSDDAYYSNCYYARQLGYPLETLNALERELCMVLGFALTPGQKEFKAVIAKFIRSRDIYLQATKDLDKPWNKATDWINATDYLPPDSHAVQQGQTRVRPGGANCGTYGDKLSASNILAFYYAWREVNTNNKSLKPQRVPLLPPGQAQGLNPNIGLSQNKTLPVEHSSSQRASNNPAGFRSEEKSHQDLLPGSFEKPQRGGSSDNSVMESLEDDAAFNSFGVGGVAASVLLKKHLEERSAQRLYYLTEKESLVRNWIRHRSKCLAGLLAPTPKAS